MDRDELVQDEKEVRGGGPGNADTTELGRTLGSRCVWGHHQEL